MILLPDKIDQALVKDQLTRRAEQLFKQGYNCCESLIKSCIEIFELNLPEDAYLMGRFFREGVGGSGCICGALAGGIMMLGYITGPNGGGAEIAESYRTGFVEKFGSSCCRVIRKKQSVSGRFRNRECRVMTGYAAGAVSEALGTKSANDVIE